MIKSLEVKNEILQYKILALMFIFSSLMSLGCESCETLHEPSNLSATTINRLQIKLTWRDNSSNEESF